MNLLILATTLLSYGLGSIPVGVLVARGFGLPDPRTHGSGHSGGRNTMRAGGLALGVLVASLDIGKGALAVWLTSRVAPQPATLALTLSGATVVAGHCWSIFLKFKGGMGLATGAGAILAYAPLIPFIAALVWLLLTRVMRHQARAAMLAALSVPPTLWLLRVEVSTLWLGVAIIAVIVLRHLADWNRVYD